MFTISAESTCDLNAEQVKKYNIKLLPMTFMVEEDEYVEDGGFEIKDFYNCMREGKKTSTSMVNPTTAEEHFKALLKEKEQDILHISLSSGISGTYKSTHTAAEQLNKTNKHQVYVIDSLSASMGQGLLCYYANLYREQGASVKEVYEKVLELSKKIKSKFTVSDLKYLLRGGRITKSKAFVATILNIKPVLHVNKEGKLESQSKAIGRNKAMQKLCEEMIEETEGVQNDTIFISHGDCLEDAQKLGQMLKNCKEIKNIEYSNIGTVIGGHSGPGTLAVFYIGK